MDRKMAGIAGRIRVGQGYDVHALVEGRPLVIGGVVIPFEKGLVGHSDADVLLHAITDALLGAAGLGDIGRHFPDTDSHWAGADSRHLLRLAYARVREAGWEVGNVDATVHAQAPKIGPHAAAMQRNIAEDLQLVDLGCVTSRQKPMRRSAFSAEAKGLPRLPSFSSRALRPNAAAAGPGFPPTI